MNPTAFPPTIIRASAGSGKTHQLTNRYLALLAGDIAPEAILATTFTRKAAGEILERVLGRLAVAAAGPAAAARLANEIGVASLDQLRAVALLRRAVRHLHRLRISTLDSFHVRLAGTFSLELGLPAGWTIGEETDDAALRQQALERFLETERPDTLLRLYERLTCGATTQGIAKELLQLVSRLYDIARDSPAETWQRITVPPGLSETRVAELLTALEAAEFAGDARMQQACAADVARARCEDWEGFLKNGLAAKIAAGEHTYRNKPIPAEVAAVYQRLIPHARARILQLIADQNRATREFLDRFHAGLWSLKQATGRLRFDEITHALAQALAHKALPSETLAFRLDGGIEHVLLDEFQDTSLSQWRVLQPLARRLVHPEQPARQSSFFCVGDVKQAIYTWRGGMPEIFGQLGKVLGPLVELPLDQSHRSAPPIIDVVNTVFQNLDRFQPGERFAEGLRAWQSRFHRHTTVKADAPGYVCLRTGPRQIEGESFDGQRSRHLEAVADFIRNLTTAAAGRSVGVLCRKNETVARMIYELRRRGVEASEEGGNPLTDSPAVELMLSLFTLADHPGHSAAWFHLSNAPALAAVIEPARGPDALARRLRRELLTLGYGKFTHVWARHVAKLCNRRDLSRLQQLIDLAYDYQARSTLRADDFVA
ncbi:MAG: UvrD-helicase domain-containing protein, partial [Gemmataceae bacterium]|nr:UvrD-helicase domain-containing protein [Gemmataceae bacterium]